MLSEVMERVPSSSSCSDADEEEEDTQTLIHVKSPKRSIFHINDTTTANNNNNNNNNKFSISKRYLFLIFLSLFILILYLSTDLLLFSTNNNNNNNNTTSSSSSSSSSNNAPILLNRMRQSELHALYLLRQQHLSLFNLFNSTTTTTPPINININNTHRYVEQLKSSLLSQISLNNQIQQLLLSTHQSASFNFDDTDPSFPAFSNINACPKVDQKLNENKKVEWKPSANKYLFAICVSGQMSNHLICLEKHMFFAALLDRVLVIPSAKVDYQFNRVLDIDHINKCLGRKVVVTFEEFAEAKKSHLHIDKFICYFSKPQSCFVDDDHVKKLKSLGMTMNKLEPAWVEDVKKPSKKTMEEVVTKFTTKEQVIAIGDVFFADLEGEMVMQPGGPIAHKCKTLIEPSRLIMLTAQRFVQTFLGEKFIALHFRRHGFLKFCNAKSPSCFFPIPQAAECISRLVEKANTPVIYLSTDAAESETNLLQSLIVLNGKMVPLVKRPARNSAEKWDALLYRHGIEGDLQVEAMLDKTISAMSSVFIGASGSTFTEDILRLRKDWGSASLCDEYLCQGELPNFIADNE